MPFAIFALAQIPYQFPQTTIPKCTRCFAYVLSRIGSLSKPIKSLSRTIDSTIVDREGTRLKVRIGLEAKNEKNTRMLLGAARTHIGALFRASKRLSSVSSSLQLITYRARFHGPTCNTTLFADWVTHSLLALASERALIYAVSHVWWTEREGRRERQRESAAGAVETWHICETAIAYKCNPFDATRAKSERSATRCSADTI